MMTDKEIAEDLAHAIDMYTSNGEDKYLQRILYFSGLLSGRFL